jgi:hypothetical protein
MVVMQPQCTVEGADIVMQSSEIDQKPPVRLADKSEK